MICTFLNHREQCQVRWLYHNTNLRCRSVRDCFRARAHQLIWCKRPLDDELQPTTWQIWKWSQWWVDYDCFRRFTFGWISKVLHTNVHRFLVKGTGIREVQNTEKIDSPTRALTAASPYCMISPYRRLDLHGCKFSPERRMNKNLGVCNLSEWTIIGANIYRTQNLKS